MWTVANRRQYDRTGLRYPSDVSDAEWALVGPLIRPAKRGGRRRAVDEREILNAIFYVLATGCQWRALPKDCPPRSTVHGYLQLWTWDGTLARLHHALYRPGPRAGRARGQPERRDPRQPKRQERRTRGPRADPTGYDAGQRVKGRKRHILVDTLGLLVSVSIHPADVQGRDGALPLLAEARRAFPFIERISADGGYRGPAPAAAVRALGCWELEVVKRADGVAGFKPLPKRWIVGRTFSWLNRCRRLAKDVEHLARTALAFLRLAMIRLMLRRLTRHSDAN